MTKKYSKPILTEYRWYVSKTVAEPTEEFTDPIDAANKFIEYENEGWMPHLRVEKRPI